MPSEYVLRLRMEEAVRDAHRANANRDPHAYNRAAAKYDAANAWLTKLEAERNEKVLRQLERRARNGELTYRQCANAGVPESVLLARGWIADRGRLVFRKVKADGPATDDTSAAVSGEEAGAQAHEP